MTPVLDVRRRDGAGGTGPLVVLLHGSMDRGAGMARTMAQLRDLDVVRYDRRGYGASEGLGDVVGIDGHVDDLLAVVDGRPSVVVGHSYGGIVGLTAASRRPSVVVAVAAFEAPMPWAPWWPSSSPGQTAARAGDGAAAAEAFLRRMLGDERWESMPGRDKRLREGEALMAELLSVSGEAPPPYDVSTLPVPVVAGRGTGSGPHLQRAAEELAASAAGSLVVIEGADHGAHLSHPVEFAAFARRAVALAPR